MDVIFQIALVLLAYTFFVYPAFIWFWSRFEKTVDRRPEFQPKVSILVPVYNEQSVIREKLENCLRLDYPTDRIEIAFASDGSTDRTMDILRKCPDNRVKIFEYPENRGKATVLNETIPNLNGDIIVLTDASGMLNPQAVGVLASYFHDESVGAVCGVYQIFKEGRTRVDVAENSYHGFEMQLRMWEGRIWSTLSGTGSLCAIRRSLYEQLPVGAINDDYILPARIALGGKRVVYAPEAHIHDRISTTLKTVYRRRVRIAFGNWQQIRYLKRLLNPLRGAYLSWVFYSHKLLRMTLPFVLMVLLVSSFSQAPWVYLSFSIAVGMLFLLGLLGLVLDPLFKGSNPFGFIVLIFFNNIAVLIGTYKFVVKRKVKW